MQPGKTASCGDAARDAARSHTSLPAGGVCRQSWPSRALSGDRLPSAFSSSWMFHSRHQSAKVSADAPGYSLSSPRQASSASCLINAAHGSVRLLVSLVDLLLVPLVGYADKGARFFHSLATGAGRPAERALTPTKTETRNLNPGRRVRTSRSTRTRSPAAPHSALARTAIRAETRVTRPGKRALTSRNTLMRNRWHRQI
jgi:hypothetical protein